ncbi:7021_t:CDS:2 [Cetraspora pellucida]|uniref:7021_t:CDS:1 n=1 Tax=Cetraspora pellucida TaxID=1433469 RepID=A0A9N9AGV0_9GLOM|nr:7021_t:CDS:2 [Cetraspora pellucida]
MFNKYEHDNIRDILKTLEVKKSQNNDSPFQIDTDDNIDTSNKQETESISLSIGEKSSINCQLLKVLISANAPLSFIENAEVIKLFHMIKPEYKLPSRKWISTDILDNILENVQCNIQRFISDSMFLTLSDDGWTNISKNIYLITWFLHPYHHDERLNPTWSLYIQEKAYGLFCSLYPDYNQDKFIDEWLNYANQEGLFLASSIQNPSFTKFPL